MAKIPLIILPIYQHIQYTAETVVQEEFVFKSTQVKLNGLKLVQKIVKTA